MHSYNQGREYVNMSMSIYAINGVHVLICPWQIYCTRSSSDILHIAIIIYYALLVPSCTTMVN